ncbi:UV-damaged DNA-binding protein rad7 [Tilletia horrida]|nr:UV-damaged DNA-binding protein rad7 [Tilletia horrida]
MCGRLVDSALDAWGKKLRKLRSLELFGPFLVRVEAWHRFFKNVGPRLQSFKIRETPRFDLECVEKMVKCCPNITQLGLAQIGKLDDKMLGPLGAYTSLTYLDISDPGVSGPGIMAESLKDESVITLLSKVGANLQTLNISGNTALTDAAVTKGIAPHCPALISLSCSGCDQITGKAFAHLWNGTTPEDDEKAQEGEDRPSSSANGKRTNGHKAPSDTARLRRINLSRALLVDDEAIIALMQHSGNALVDINLNSVDLMTERALSAMAQYCKSAVTIDLSFCRSLDDSLLVDLMKIPTLQKVLVWGCNRVSDFVIHPRVAIIGKERSAVL